MLPEPTADTHELLEWIHSLVIVCPRCRLSQSRRNAVPGEGSPTAALMLVGEAPGTAEDAQGRPFVGASGRLLSELLAEIGLRREDVFIGNVVKCRPPNNREPKDDEIEACNDYLVGQIAAIRPQVIATLGKHAGRTLIDPDFSISRIHGMPLEKHGIHYMPLYHPAYALYNQSQRDVLRADMQKLGQLLTDLGVHRAQPLRRAG